MKYKYILTLCVCLLFKFCNFCFANETDKIDSLTTVLKTSKEDTNKVITLNILSYELSQEGEYNPAEKYADSALKLSQKINYKRGEATSYNNIGISFDYHGDYPKALENYFSSLKITKELGDKVGTAMAYNNIGLIFWFQGNYSEALKYHFASLKIAEELGNKFGIAMIHNNIGNIYINQHNYAGALNHFLIALKIREEIGDRKGLAASYNGIGNAYDGQNKNAEALKNFSAALKLNKEIGDREGIAGIYTNIGDIYKDQGNYEDALKSELSALKIFEEIGYNEGIAVAYSNLGSLYTKLAKTSEAKKCLEKGLYLSKAIGARKGIIDSYFGLAELDSMAGNYKQSLEYYKLYTIYKDSMLNETSSEQTAEMQTKYETEKKDNEILLLNKDKEIQNKEIQRQKLLKNSLIGGLGLMLILVFLGYRTYRTKQQLKLQTLRNKIASDLHDDVGSTLSSISIFSEMAKEQSSEVTPMLEQIGDSSRKMLDAMADIVWTINSDNDNFERIILRMKSFAYELLGAKKIDFEFDADENVSNLKLPMDVRKNLYLIFKEATNNMVKYADASKASFSVSGNKGKLTMFIRDNGKGFDVNKDTQGNGLKNMNKRAQEIGAKLLIESESETGTTIQIILNLG